MMKLLTLLALSGRFTGVAAQATAEACASDVDGDGLINVNDLLGMLGQFGSTAGGAEDINSDGVVNVNDLLQVLSNFNADISSCSNDGGMAIGGGGGSDAAVNCCGGGSACGYIHCPALGAGQDGCVQPWALPNGMTEDSCNAGVSVGLPEPAAPLMCPDSPPLQCRMMCPPTVQCPNNQCNMRQGTCCDMTCEVFDPNAGEACSGCCPPGADCFAPDPPCCARIPPPPAPSNCVQGQDCGGQVWNDCGTSCPAMCGVQMGMMCNMMCNAEYQCPNGLCFNEATGSCLQHDASSGGGELPPMIAVGRPFLAAKASPHAMAPEKMAPVSSDAVAAFSDWMVAL